MTTENALEPSHAAHKNVVRRLYDWTLEWGETKYAVPALCIISFAESSFFPIPPDVLLMAMCFASPKKWWSHALWCTIASVLGGIFGWYIGANLWHVVAPFFFKYVPGFTPDKFNHWGQWVQQHGFWVVVAKGLTPIPFKLITISAGAFKMDLLQLIGASIISRGFRFFLVAGLIRAFGPRIRPFLEKHLDRVLLASFVLLILGFVAVKFI